MDPEASPEELAEAAEDCAEAVEAELSPYHPLVPLLLKRSADALDRGGYFGAAATAMEKAVTSLSVAFGKSHAMVAQLEATAKAIVVNALGQLPPRERAAMVAAMSPAERSRWGLE